MPRLKNRPLPPLTESDIERFWSKVDRSNPDGCWPWTASCFPNGYPQFQLSGEPFVATRVAYFIQYGVDPMDLGVLHHCDNPPCCRGKCLFLGTALDNKRDSMAKGRHAKGDNTHARLYPEQFKAAYQKGLATRRLNPEKYWPRGKRSWVSLHPEKVKRGDDHWTKQHPDLIRRGYKLPSGTHRGESNGKAILSEQQVLDIRAKRKQGVPVKILAKDNGVGIGTIYAIVKRRIWAHL